jgi:SecY interacting protein Syd
MALSICEQLDNFVSSYVENADEGVLSIPYDKEWPSLCYKSESEQGRQGQQGLRGEIVPWQPVRQTQPLSFDNVGSALELTLDSDYCTYFTRYFSNNLIATAPQGECELLQVWNEEDFERLQQNLIGHLLMKQRLEQAPTLFFGLTDEEDFILTVINKTGEVALEQVGMEPKEILAPSLATFLSTLKPSSASR